MANRRPVAIALTLAMVIVIFVAKTSASAGTAPDLGVAVTRDVVYWTTSRERLTLDAYVPTAKAAARPVILLVHGGGWEGGKKSDFTLEAYKLAELGYVAFSVNYRLAPAHPYPAAIDDVQAAVRWVRAPTQLKKYGLDPKRIGALGSSAGGHLVGMLATLGHGSLSSGARIRAAVSWSGPMDLSLTPPAALPASSLDSAVLEFLGCTLQPCPNATAASPIGHVDTTDAPMLLANSDDELVPLAHALRMDAALKAAGVPEQLVVFPGDRHAEAYADDVWPQTLGFFAKYVRKPSPSGSK